MNLVIDARTASECVQDRDTRALTHASPRFKSRPRVWCALGPHANFVVPSRITESWVS